MNNIKSFTAGVCSALLITGMTLPSMADLVTEKIDVYKNSIKVYVNDRKIEPKDVNGNPVDIYVHNGTTYLPIRAIANALDVPVLYDANTQSAYLGTHFENSGTNTNVKQIIDGSPNSIFNVCSSYTMDYFEIKDKIWMTDKDKSKEIENVLIPVPVNNTSKENLIEKRKTNFNLNGKYSKITFKFGHINGRGDASGIWDIYFDDKLVYTLEGTSKMSFEEYEMDVTGVKNVVFHGRTSSMCYGMFDIELYK